MKFNEELFRLHAMLPSYQKKVSESQQIIEDFLEVTERPYVAFSTGKDSTALLGLVRECSDVVAVHLDNGVELPGTKEVRESFDNVIHHQGENFIELAKKYGLGSKETRKALGFQEVIDLYGFDGVFMGLRKSESAARSYNAKRGMIYKKTNGLLVCQPLLHWTIKDAFAYLVVNDLPIHEHYKLPGPFPLEERRVGSYVSSRNRGAEYGRFRKLEFFYPDIYRELVYLFPELKKY